MNTPCFRGIAYGVARQLGWRVGGVTEPGVTPNFWVAGLNDGSRMRYMLCSVRQDWAVSATLEPGGLQFEDCPSLASLLASQHGIRLLNAAELDAPFAFQGHLSESDVRYWKPRSMGEALFNWWD